ncbi:hypothetical protein ES703_11212 [subsurface metagenome]
MNNIDLIDTAKTREIYTEKEKRMVERLCESWERFLEHDFKKEKEKGVFARELDANTMVYSEEQLRRVVLLAFIAGVVTEETERIRLEIERLRE